MKIENSLFFYIYEKMAALLLMGGSASKKECQVVGTITHRKLECSI